MLQDRTIEAWNGELADLRVHPLTDQSSSLTVTDTLGRRDSPLADLFRAVWHQTGSDDRSRGYASQLKVAASFGPMIQYVDQGVLPAGSTRVRVLTPRSETSLSTARRSQARCAACRRRIRISSARPTESRLKAIQPNSLSSSSRDDDVRAMTGWSPASLADLGTVLVRRSGRPLASTVPGLYAQVGWEYARDGGARAAIGRAAAVRAQVIGAPAAAVTEEAVEIEQVFADLNAAFAAGGSNAEVDRRRLMDVQHRATSMATLNQTPRIVVQIIEDVLAQTAVSGSSAVRSPR